MNSRARGAAVALTALTLFSGCSSGEAESGPTAQPTHNIVQPGAPGQPNTTLTEVPEIPDYVVEADYTFMRHMLQHHAQAVVMTALVPEQAEHDGLKLFAERMGISQEEEIDIMQNWLLEQGQPVLDLDAHHGTDSPMPGMLTEAQLDELSAATGAEFDRLFLRFMYQHHEGALQMVEELYAADGAQDPFVFRIAKEIDSDQRIEMDRMLEMQQEMGFGDYGAQAGDS